MQVLGNMEAAQRSAGLLAALKQGNAALQQLQRAVPLEEVESLNEQTAEARDYQERVQARPSALPFLCLIQDPLFVYARDTDLIEAAQALKCRDRREAPYYVSYLPCEYKCRSCWGSR